MKTLDAKHKIFLATLNIIRQQGMRAVRHRAVAEEAKVSLGSTTYHFKSLEDLIASTFVYWIEHDNENRGSNLASIEQSVMSYVAEHGTSPIESLYQAACGYLETQIIKNRDDRFIECSFHNEATRNPLLSELILTSWQTDVAILAEFYQALGSKFSEQDARDTHALIMQLEKQSLMFSEEQLLDEFEQMKLTLKRHLDKVLGS